MGFETHLEFRFHLFFHAQNLRVIESIEGFSIGALGYEPPEPPESMIRKVNEHMLLS